MENVFMTTTERKRMSTKTTFKRIALVAVAALGLGVLSVAPSSAAVTDETLTVSASATSINPGDSVTLTVTNVWTSSADSDSRVILVDTSTSSGAGVISKVYFRTSSDTVNATVAPRQQGVAYTRTTGIFSSDTATSAAGAAKYNRVVTTVLLQNFTKAGTYYVSVSSADATGGPGFVAKKTVLTTITVTDLAPTGVNLYTSTDTVTGQSARVAFGAVTDSAVAAPAGTAETPTFVAYIFPVVTTLGSYAGDSQTAGGTNFCTSQAAGACQVQVSVSGPGLVVAGDLSTAATASNRKKSVALNVSNGGASFNSFSDTIIVMSDGTAGTGTITFTMGSTVLGTKSVTFAGTASTITAYYVDTVISKSASAQTAVKALVKDSAGNKLTTGTVYAYSSDTAVISDSPVACTYSTTYAMHACAITTADTGTASITIRNKATVSTSTIASDALSFTVRGTLVKSFTASFDKASYAPGEKAILTVNAKDVLGNTIDGAISSAFTITQDKSFSSGSLNTTFTPYLATGSETTVVYMPNAGGTVTITIAKGTGAWADMAAVTLTPTIVDATKDAADAATDAALEATDAAYAAQDAAQLAAEAADAATAAAEAATAAVEDLATQVASLFADLQKQITTLANVVAKIAKKVKA